MTFSSLVAPANIHLSPQFSSRNGTPIDHFILHHSAAFDVSQVIAEMVSGSRQVSANYVVGNDGTAYGIIPEEDRAWTSGSPYDGGKGAAWDTRSITFEILDQTGAPDWLISPAAQATVSAIIADCSKRYGIVPQREGANTDWTVYGHRELWDIYGASYATACPGGLPLDAVTISAASLTKTSNPPKDIDMIIVAYSSSTPRNGIWLFAPGFQHQFTAEEWTNWSGKLAGVPVVTPINDRDFDLGVSVFTANTAVAPSAPPAAAVDLSPVLTAIAALPRPTALTHIEGTLS